MKKEKIMSLVVCFLVISLLSCGFVSAEIIKTNKESYTNKESVSLRSSSQLCNNIAGDEDVKVYVVKDKEQWQSQDNLIDVSKGPHEVPNSRFSAKKIWENPDIGNYDVIVDCIENEKYDVLEPVDGLDEIGFSVVAKKGVGRVLKGDSEVKDFKWQYDPDEPDLLVEIMQIKLSVENEDVRWVNMTAELIGKILDIAGLEIYSDKNNNAGLDPVDVKIGEAEVIGKRVDVLFEDYVLSKGSKNILIVLKFKEDISKGEYGLELVSLNGRGVSSDKDIRFSGLPVESGKISVLDKKACFGTLNLRLNPSQVLEGSEVVLKVSNLTGCDNKKVLFLKNKCSSVIKEQVGFCVLENGFCDIMIKALSDQKYYACVDKNGDGDMFDFGESVSGDLVVKEKIQPTTSEEEEVKNDSGISNQEDFVEGQGASPITGRVVSGNFLQDSDPLLVLLEVTLLLILFVLVLILFKLRGPVNIESVSEKDDSEDSEEGEREKK